MPSAAGINFASYAVRYGIQEVVARYVALVSTLAHERMTQPFSALDGDSQLAILNATRTADILLFSAFLTHVFRAYYTDREVLERIGSGSVPPYPDGNPCEPDDWTILEPVYERGQMYRNVTGST